jgi:hypothetical protein
MQPPPGGQRGSFPAGRRDAANDREFRLAVLVLVGALAAGNAPQIAGQQAEHPPPAARSAPSAAFDEELKDRLLPLYGWVLVARGGATPPPGVLFADEDAVTLWQAGVPTERAEMGGMTVELQSPALQSLLNARAEVRKLRLDVTPRAADAARRTYADTVKLWQSRVHPGLRHWVRKGRLTQQEAQRIRALPPREQVPEILRLEEQGLFFSTNRTKSILYSVAAPGASQHISMLAFDIKEHGHREVRATLARHGWFQTVPSDLPHFAFLGCGEEELPGLGLKKVTQGKRDFWVLDPSRTAGSVQ